MTTMRLALLPLGLLLAAVPALAQQAPADFPPATAASTVCSGPAPQIPAVDWRGKASYAAKAKTQGGRVVAIEVRPLTTGIDRRSQRALVQAISQSLQVSRCEPGEHVFERTFSFDLPAAAEPASAASR